MKRARRQPDREKEALNVGAGDPPTMSVPTRSQSGASPSRAEVVPGPALQVRRERRPRSDDRPGAGEPEELSPRHLHLGDEEVVIGG